MAQRHVASLVWRDREREAAQLRLHRIEIAGLDVDRDQPDIARPFDPGPQPVEAAHRFVFGAVEFLRMRDVEAGGGERLRGEHAGFASPLAGRVGLCLRPSFRLGPRLGPRLGSRLGPFGTITRLASAGRVRRSARRATRSRRGRGRKQSLARAELRIGCDLAGIDSGEFGDTTGQRVKFHGFEERNEPLVIRLMNGEIADRHVERDAIVERYKLFRQPRGVGVVDQGLAALLLFDLDGTVKERLQISVFADELRGGFHADPRHAGHVVG